LVVEDCDISGQTWWGLHVWRTTLKVTNSRLHSSHKGLSVGNESKAVVENCEIFDNEIALSVPVDFYVQPRRTINDPK
jgi:predicted regulator of amino acid metabolism with ACT domain